jgi:hypothetical protein
LPQPPNRIADPAVEKDLRSRLHATPGAAAATARDKPLGWRGPAHGVLTVASPVKNADKQLSLAVQQQRPIRRLSTDYFEGSGAGGGGQAVAALRRADSAPFGDGTQQQQQQQQQSVPSVLKRRSSKSKVSISYVIRRYNIAACTALCICSYDKQCENC